MPRATATDLLFVSKSNKEKLDSLAFGASLVARTGYDLQRLKAKAALDRFDLARIFLKDAKFAASSAPPMHRAAVSRAYYSMYHALRAVVFIEHGGDDHEQHSKLPSQIPANFPRKSYWENALKNARLERNRADYDPYPRKSVQFRSASDELIARAEELLPAVASYLRART